MMMCAQTVFLVTYYTRNFRLEVKLETKQAAPRGLLWQMAMAVLLLRRGTRVLLHNAYGASGRDLHVFQIVPQASYVD